MKKRYCIYNPNWYFYSPSRDNGVGVRQMIVFSNREKTFEFGDRMKLRKTSNTNRSWLKKVF